MCGRLIQYGHLTVNKAGKQIIKDEFTLAKINFSRSIEIYNIRSTANPNYI